MGLYESETRFYQEIAPLSEITVPAFYWGDVEPETGRATMVIEDLTGSAEVGDPIAKATPEQADHAFAELVKLQAPLWNDPRLRERTWLADPRRVQMMFDAVAPSIGPFTAAYRDLLEPEHVALVEQLGPKAATWPAKALRAPLVVMHSDFRPDNMMFAKVPGAPPVTIVDWQACGLGAALVDHAIFLAGCMSTEDRRATEHDLLQPVPRGPCRERRPGLHVRGLPGGLPAQFPVPIPARGRDVARHFAHRAGARAVRTGTPGAAQLVLDLGAVDFLD